METVSIRHLRGADLQERTREGKPLAVTNRGALIGVIIPASSAWVEHLVFHNWARVRQRIAEGERAIAGHSGPVGDDAERPERGTGQPVAPLDAAVVGKTVVQSPASADVVSRLRAALNPLASGEQREGASAEPSGVRPIRMGDLSAARIEKAGVNGQTLAVTHDRNLIGILIPVTQDLVQFLIERNMSSVLDSIRRGEGQINGAGPV
jgi:antitoxin (DNA-binding transcriptional repressor) of toxin-antitoxin stability system